MGRKQWESICFTGSKNPVLDPGTFPTDHTGPLSLWLACFVPAPHITLLWQSSCGRNIEQFRNGPRIQSVENGKSWWDAKDPFLERTTKQRWKVLLDAEHSSFSRKMSKVPSVYCFKLFWRCQFHELHFTVQETEVQGKEMTYLVIPCRPILKPRTENISPVSYCKVLSLGSTPKGKSVCASFFS